MRTGGGGSYPVERTADGAAAQNAVGEKKGHGGNGNRLPPLYPKRECFSIAN